MRQPWPQAARIAIVRNPRSGTAPEPSALARAAQLVRLPVTVADAPLGSALEPWLRRVAADFDIVVAAGGDGTVSSVAAAVAGAGKTLAIIPTGTLNHFARDAGVPTDLDAATAAIADGHERLVDIGVVNDHVFINNVSLGNYPLMVNERGRIEHEGRSRRVAAIAAFARTWWQLRNISVTMTIDDERAIRRRSPFILIGNNSYVMSGLSLGTREQISGGSLSIYIAPSTGRVGALALPIRALLGTLERHEQFETLSASTITASFTRSRIPVAIDGEVCELDTPLRFAIRRRALKILVPAA